jgi:dipeptidyl aminopeptidase/acylaminoacyl peptidase
VLTGTLLWLSPLVLGQEDPAASKPYQMPPKAIAALIDAPPTPSVSVGPNNRWMLLMQRPSLPPVSEIAQPEMRLAGRRINPRTNGRSRVSHYTGLTLKRMDDQSERPIQGLPKEPRLGSVRWSPDGRQIAFTHTCEDGIELWVADVATAKATRLTEPRLNGAYGSPYEWVSDSRTLVCRLVPRDRGEAPEEPRVPRGPVIRKNLGKTAPARTYQDLLKNAHDEALFDYYLASIVATVTLDGKITELGSPAVIARADPAPDGAHILVETVHRPYSYLVPLSRFPRRIEVWDLGGRMVRQIADLPLAEEVPVGFGAVPTGPRSFGWRADAPAVLYWVEAQDGGDPRKEAEVRDRVYVLAPPFDGDPVALVSVGLRFGGIMWGSEQLALVSEWWWKNRKTRTWRIDPSRPGSEPELLIDRSFEDRYNDPGRPILNETLAGTAVLLTADGGNTLFLSGPGASPEGDRPFLDRFDLRTREHERLWRSEAPYYEYAVDLLDPDEMTVLTRRETKTEPPNYFVRSLRGGDLRRITDFPHPAPQLADVYKEMVRYERADGVNLTGTLYLPPGKKPEDGPWPMLVWAYPQEYKDADAAGQVTDSPYRFVRTHSHSPLLWLLHGYAVLDDPTLPIVGEGDEEPNDTYVEQLVAGARAAIDEMVRRGVADPDRVAVGGHSYGAFMTANLLAHSDLFRAGIARSGAYNRTLTPFGFQAEERTLWEAPDVYATMSPFMHADKVNEPILLIHGEADNNSGTYPMQSERYYNALKGHGATCRLVMLPHESHGYRSRESVMHMAWEMTRWLDEYVKNAEPRQEAED